MPQIADDILKRWHQAAQFYWDDTSSSCTHCGIQFATGDVCFLFGDLDSAIAKKEYLCPQDGMAAVVHGNRMPSATTLFIEDAHRDKRLSKLPKEIRDRVVESFQIIDNIHRGVEERLAAILDREAQGKAPS